MTDESETDDDLLQHIHLASLLVHIVEMHLGDVDANVEDVLGGYVTYTDLIDFIEALPQVHRPIAKKLLQLDGDPDKVFPYLRFLAQTMLDKTTSHGKSHFVGLPSDTIH